MSARRLLTTACACIVAVTLSLPVVASAEQPATPASLLSAFQAASAATKADALLSTGESTLSASLRDAGRVSTGGATPTPTPTAARRPAPPAASSDRALTPGAEAPAAGAKMAAAQPPPGQSGN